MPKAYLKSRVAKSAVRRVLDPLGFGAPKVRPRDLSDDTIHFFHLGRCAGTTIKEFIDKFNEGGHAVSIIPHEHKVVLAKIPERGRYFFSIREPVDRFFSAFNWRQARRTLGPAKGDSHTEQERKAFARFANANELAESLYAEGERGIEAFTAMQEIKHVNRPQYTWFPSVEEVLSARPPLCIIRLDKMQRDLDYLAAKLQVENRFELTSEKRKRHRNVYSVPPPLSDKAVDNLRRWYAADIQFYELAKAWAEQHQDQGQEKSPA